MKKKSKKKKKQTNTYINAPTKQLKLKMVGQVLHTGKYNKKQKK